MGFVNCRVKIGIIDPKTYAFASGQYDEIKALVDTGSTYSSFSGELLKKYTQPIRKMTLLLADGRKIERFYGYAWVTINEDKNLFQVPVIFGEKDDPSLVGTITLEHANFVVDPIKKTLIKREAYIQY